ncbi:MAG: 50S ribosomal protein L23 [Candidatus Aenigmatarchaeota archaeon]
MVISAVELRSLGFFMEMKNMDDKKQKSSKDEKSKKEKKTKKSLLGKARKTDAQNASKLFGKTKEYKFPVVSDPYNIIRFVLMTEKSLQNIEIENKLTFMVYNNANKKQVKDAIESAFKKRVKKVNMLIDQKSRKKAMVRFVEDGAAGDIAMKLGML